MTERRGEAFPPSDVLLRIDTQLDYATLIRPGERYWAVLRELLDRVQPQGAEVFDLQILAVAIEHGADEVWTFDRGFPADARVRVVDPLAS